MSRDEVTTAARAETTPGEVHTLLLDADGVLQGPADGWLEKWRPHAGEDLDGFVHRLLLAERPALRGEATIHECVEGFLRDIGGPESARDEIVSAWAMIDVFGDAFALIDEVRAAGTRCCLATNQHEFRRDIMLGLGYGEHVDRAFFSCDLGAAKPDPAYFDAVLQQLGCGPGGVVFIDDRADNVETARSVGLTAHVHETRDRAGQGIRELRSLLRAAGVPGL